MPASVAENRSKRRFDDRECEVRTCAAVSPPLSVDPEPPVVSVPELELVAEAAVDPPEVVVPPPELSLELLQPERASTSTHAISTAARATIFTSIVASGPGIGYGPGPGRDALYDRSMADSVIDKLTRNAVDVLPAGALERKLSLGRPLRVKLGIDVTSPDIHVGRGIPLQRMRAFQDEGHIGVLIIGDYTTRIGDPSGRSAERPILSDDEIDANALTYIEQACQILDRERTEVRFNGEWLSRLSFADVVRLTRTMTVARLLERDDFAKRYGGNEPISVSELLYPLMQAYDSVAVQADVELGGTDQLYNLLAGREIMQAYGLDPQVVLTTPILISWDGAKMSSSLGNTVPLTAVPEEQFGRTMRIADALLDHWYRLLPETAVPDSGPLEAKLALARWITARSHGEDAARRAEEHFTRVVRKQETPEDVPGVLCGPGPDAVFLPPLLKDVFGLGSTSEARRLIEQGAVKIDGEVISTLELPAARLDGSLVQAGRRGFARIVVQNRPA